MTIEDVERHRRVQGIAERDGLAEDVSSSEFGAAAIPGAPFVDHEPGVMLRIVLAHDLPVLVDYALDMRSFVQDGVPPLRVEPGAVFGRLPKIGVVVQRKAVDSDAETACVVEPGEKALGPADIGIGRVATWSCGHEKGGEV